MQLVIRLNDAANNYPQVALNPNYAGPYLPSVGDDVFAGAQTLKVQARRFDFSPGNSPDLDAVEIIVG